LTRLKLSFLFQFARAKRSAILWVRVRMANVKATADAHMAQTFPHLSTIYNCLRTRPSNALDCHCRVHSHSHIHIHIHFLYNLFWFMCLSLLANLAMRQPPAISDGDSWGNSHKKPSPRSKKAT